MKVSEVMTRGVEVIHPQAGLPEAAMTMRSLDVGSLPVVKDGRLEGILTDRDIAMRAVAEGRDLATTLVEDIMSRGVAFVHEDDDLETASRLMADLQVRRVPVFGPDRELTGILAPGGSGGRAPGAGGGGDGPGGGVRAWEAQPVGTSGGSRAKGPLRHPLEGRGAGRLRRLG